jgi:hypothetical protein
MDDDRHVRPLVTYLMATPAFTLMRLYATVGKRQVVEFRSRPVSIDLHPTYLFLWRSAKDAALRTSIEVNIRDSLMDALKDEREKLQPHVTDADFKRWAKPIIDQQVAAIWQDPTTKSFITFAGLRRDFGNADLDVPTTVANQIVLVFPLTRAVFLQKAKKRESMTAVRAQARQKSGAKAAAAPTRPEASPGTLPVGPAGIEGRRNAPPGSESALKRDCADSYSTRYSAANPERYVDASEFQKDQPLLGEPSLDALLNDGVTLQGWIGRLAAEIRIQPYRYAGNFCLAAGTAIAERARRLGEEAATEVATAGILKPTNQGNLGFVQFDPQSTPAVRELHDLARMLDDVIDLGNRAQSVYRSWWANLCGRWYQYEPQWGLAFDTLFHPIKSAAVNNIFKAACRVLMLQLLESSKSQIEARKKNLTTYAPVFEFLLRAYFTDKSDLEKLKARLEGGRLLARLTTGPASPPAGSWLTLGAGLSEALRKSDVAAPASVTIRDNLVYRGDALVGVQDEHGVFWTEEALEQALTQREFLVESIDPLIKQISNDEADFILATLNQKHGAVQYTANQLIEGGDLGQAIFERVRNEQNVTTGIVVEAILDKLLSNNATEFRRTRASFDHAFNSAPLYSGGRSYRIPYCSFELMGIHKLADEQIGTAFRSNPEAYGWELNDLLSGVAGGRSLTRFFTFAGIVVLSVVCPPLGAALGAATAIIDYREALEKKTLFRSLIDPDLVITRAEVEAELFAAELGLALSFIPEAAGIIGRAARGFEIVMEQGVRGSARAVVSGARRALTLEGAQAAAAALRNRFAAALAERLKDGLAQAIAVEFVKAEVMNELLGKLLIEPVIEGIYQDFKDYSQGARGPGAVVHLFRKDAP